MDDLLKRIQATHQKVLVIDDKEFTLKLMDDVQNRKLINSIKDRSEFETEIILASVIDYKNIKVKDVVASTEGFTADELNENVPFSKEYLRLFLGANQDAWVTLYAETAKSFMEYVNKKNEQKKNYDTQSKKQSSQQEKKQQETTSKASIKE